MNAPDEILPLVDSEDKVIGAAPRRLIHAQGLRHRAVHVLVFDPRGRIYLQLRSAAKDSHPGKWTSSASGHVDPGESYLQAARRELKEELGLELSLTPAGRIAACAGTENEFTEIFRAQTHEEPRPDPVEISRGDFFTPEQALDLARDPQRACPSLIMVLETAWPKRR